jgi:hypothetical protein
MEAASTFKTSVNFYQTTQCNSPEDCHLHTHCRENLKSHLETIKKIPDNGPLFHEEAISFTLCSPKQNFKDNTELFLNILGVLQ